MFIKMVRFTKIFLFLRAIYFRHFAYDIIGATLGHFTFFVFSFMPTNIYSYLFIYSLLIAYVYLALQAFKLITQIFPKSN